MPFCSLRPVWVEDTGETVQHIYILHESIEPNLDAMDNWIKENFPDHETLSIGKHYIMKNAEDFAFAFKLTWE